MPLSYLAHVDLLCMISLFSLVYWLDSVQGELRAMIILDP